MRLVGVQLRSMFSAAIYKKLLRVSPSSGFSSGEIVSLASIDAYRIGEFPFQLHQLWTTPLQLILALLILYYCVGLAALAALFMIILTVLGNSPVARIQAVYQRKIMEKQDKMVQFISVSLSAMKVLKLYAWDLHFKKVVREIVSLVSIDAYRIGEFPFQLHQLWTTPLQLVLALIIVYYCVGLAALAALFMIILTVLGNSPVARIQAVYQRKIMEKQDKMVQFISVSLSAMKVLKLYAWDLHFKKVVRGLREEEYKWVKAVQVQRGDYIALFWLSPVLLPVTVLASCYYLRVVFTAANVFAFLAAINLLQDPIRQLPDVLGAYKMQMLPCIGS